MSGREPPVRADDTPLAAEPSSPEPELAPPTSSPEPALRVGPGGVTVTGRVMDEAGAPIAGASVAVSSEEYVRAPCVTDANGAFETTVPPTPALRLAASHPDYGEQWTDMLWRGWSRYDVITADPVRLTLRRGVVLRGQLLGPDARPRAHETLLLVPGYVGSGPRPLTTTTDADGRFTFPRAVLSDFELVPRSIDDWHAEQRDRAGEHLRIVQQSADWIAHARADEPIAIAIEPFTLVTATFRLAHASGAPLARENVDLWLRTSPTSYVGTMPRTDARGRCRALMERGVAYDVWALPDHAGREMPWTQSLPPSWHGSIDAATEIAITVP